MYRFLHFAAIAANVLLVLAALYIFTSAYGSEKFIAVLIAVPPVLALAVLLGDVSGKERRLAKKVRMARLQRELETLEGKSSG